MGDELARIASYQWPVAHLGHLTEGQQRALDKFKKIVEKSGYYQPSLSGQRSPSHDDETLLRYLRARKFNPEEAFKQFKDTEDWRKENHLDELYRTIDIDEYDQTRRLYPQWTGRRDRRGIPVYVFEVAHLNSKTISTYQNAAATHPTVAHNSSKVPTRMLRLFALYENLTRFVLPLCSAINDRPHAETPISQSNNIVDISRVGLKQFWNLKTHMQDASQLATAHYPETLDRIFIIGAPSFFPTVWSWIKRWFDPITVSKIFILSSANMKSTLEKYIDPDNIPKKYGGKLDYEFGSMPDLEPSIVDALELLDPAMIQAAKKAGVRTIPKGPITWRECEGDEMEAVAVGSEGGKPRERPIARIRSAHHHMYGIARGNTPIDWTLEKVDSTPGTNTQPTEEGDPFFGADLPSGTSTPISQLKDNNDIVATKEDDFTGPAPPEFPVNMSSTIAAAGGTPAQPICNNTTSVPAKSLPSGEAQPVSSSQPRAGTSDTRAAQTDVTHASGQQQVEENTPHLVDHGNNDKTSTIETSTVGQAPKDPLANLPVSEEPPQPTIIDRAKEVAGQAYSAATDTTAAVVSTVVSAVGMGTVDAPEEKKPEPQSEAPHDEGVAKTSDRNVEEYLRSRTFSGTATAEAAAKNVDA